MALFTPIIDVKHKAYCGPTAIAALTGVPVSRIEKMLRRCRSNGYRNVDGRKLPIRGTYRGEMIKVLKRLGCKVSEYKHVESTFGRFVEDTRFVDAMFLVNVTGHWMTSCKGTICDTSVITPKPADDYHRKQRRVKAVWKVEAPEKPKYTIDDPITPPKREPKPKPDIKIVRAQRLVEQIKWWEAKEKRAKTALAKLRPKLRRYQKLGVAAA